MLTCELILYYEIFFKIMKGVLSKIVAFFLAFLVLLSSSFVTIETHYCCGNVVDLSIFGKADVCAMDMISCKLENTSATRLKNSCCYNSIVNKSSELFKKSKATSVDFQQFNFLPNLYSTTISNFFIETNVRNIYFKDYSSPLITKDILVLVQRFLI